MIDKLIKEYRFILKRKSLLYFFIAFFISDLGTTLSFMARGYLVYEITHSSLSFAFYFFISDLPRIFLSPFVGAFIDTRKKTKILIYQQTMAGVLILPYIWVRDIKLIYILAFFQSIIGLFYFPSYASLIPLLCKKEELTRVNSAENVINNTVEMAGPALAGFLIALLGLKLIFIIDAITYFIAAFLIYKFVEENIETEISKWLGIKNFFKMYKQKIKDGFKYLVKEPIVKFFLSIEFFTTLIGGMVNIFLMFFVLDILKGDIKSFGMMSSIASIGTLLASFLLGPLTENIFKPMLYSFSTVLLGFTFVWFSSLNSILFSYFIFFLIGVLNAGLQISFMSGLQKHTLQNHQGSIFSLYLAIFSVSNSISIFGGGFVSKVIGLRKLYLASGLILIAIGILAFNFANSLKLKISRNDPKAVPK